MGIGPLGGQEMILIFLLALLLFGPKKLPEIGKTIGKALTEFHRAKNELKSTFEREMKTLEQENESLKQVTSPYQYDTYNYDYASYESGNSISDNPEPCDSAAASPSTPGASATEGAESPSHTAPEGVVARNTVPVNGAGGEPQTSPAVAPTTSEHNA